MALTKVKGSGVEGITNLSNATFLSVDASEVATLLTTAVINSEGGAVTTNIAQGLAKSWSKHNNTGTISITDSFNLASISDIGTGTADFTLTNSFSNTTYSIVATCSDTSAHMQVTDSSQATGSYRYRTLDGSLDLIDDPAVYGNTHGDLA